MVLFTCSAILVVLVIVAVMAKLWIGKIGTRGWE
jgi:hypothetical protein